MKEPSDGSLRVLADTQVLLWYLGGSARLSSRARELLQDDSTDIYFSVESIREIAIKYSLRKPDFGFEPREVYGDLLALGWKQIETKADHVFALEAFTHVHGDPFDRLLLAQAKVEQLTLLTTDARILEFASLAMRAS